MGILFYKDENGVPQVKGGKIMEKIVAIPLFIIFAVAMLIMGAINAVGRFFSRLFFGSKGC